MIVTRSRKFTINMGNYESLATEASVTLDTEHLAVPEGSTEAEVGFAYAEKLLVQALAEDLAEAGRLTDVRTSFVLQDTTLTEVN